MKSKPDKTKYHCHLLFCFNVIFYWKYCIGVADGCMKDVKISALFKRIKSSVLILRQCKFLH